MREGIAEACAKIQVIHTSLSNIALSSANPDYRSAYMREERYTAAQKEEASQIRVYMKNRIIDEVETPMRELLASLQWSRDKYKQEEL